MCWQGIRIGQGMKVSQRPLQEYTGNGRSFKGRGVEDAQ